MPKKSQRSRSEAARAGWETRWTHGTGPRGEKGQAFLRSQSQFQTRSVASRKGWEKRWERGTAPIGKQGQKFIQREYGPTLEPPEEPDYDDWLDFYEVEY